jgi:hypothetical protein
MSKSKGNTPNVEMRRRNQNSQASTPAEELREVLQGPETGSSETQAAEMFVATRPAQLDPYEAEVLQDDDSKNPELYHPANLEFLVTRFPKGANDETKELLTRFIFDCAQAIGGFRNGWRLDMSGSRTAVEWEPSRVHLYFTERNGKAIGWFYQDWAHRIAQQGINDGTTIDFMVIEKNNDGTEVIDAWNCRSMYPMEACGCDSGFTRSERCVETCSFVVELGGNVMRGKQVLEEATQLWKQQAQGQAA